MCLRSQSLCMNYFTSSLCKQLPKSRIWRDIRWRACTGGGYARVKNKPGSGTGCSYRSRASRLPELLISWPLALCASRRSTAWSNQEAKMPRSWLLDGILASWFISNDCVCSASLISIYLNNKPGSGTGRSVGHSALHTMTQICSADHLLVLLFIAIVTYIK